MARVVFVGLGFGGLYALRHFMDDGPPNDATVIAIDRRDRFVFTPLLHEFLADELDIDVVAPKLSSLVPEGVQRIQGDVAEIDVEGGQLRLSDGGMIPFDTLVLAPGSVPAYHGVPGAEQHGLPFYSFEDAERLKSALQLREWAGGSQPACVVGGGVVGIELAFALAELVRRIAGRDIRPPVVVLEALGDVLGGMSAGVRKRAKRKLAARGIEVRTNVRVLEVDETGVWFEANGTPERFDAAVVAWTAGIQPNPLIDRLPAERHGKHGVVVTPTLQLPTAPGVFVIGDAIAYPDSGGGEPVPDTAQAALQEAQVCASNLRTWLKPNGKAREFRFDSMGEFLRVAQGEAIANIRGAVVDGAPAAFARRTAYLLRLPAWAVRTTAVRQWLG